MYCTICIGLKPPSHSRSTVWLVQQVGFTSIDNYIDALLSFIGGSSSTHIMFSSGHLPNGIAFDIREKCLVCLTWLRCVLRMFHDPTIAPCIVGPLRMPSTKELDINPCRSSSIIGPVSSWKLKFVANFLWKEHFRSFKIWNYVLPPIFLKRYQIL